MSSEVAIAQRRLVMMPSSSYRQRPRSASSRSSFVDLSPLPENVDLSIDEGLAISRSFDSAATDEKSVRPKKQLPRRPHTNPEYIRKGDSLLVARDSDGRRRPQMTPQHMEKQRSESYLGLSSSVRRPSTAPVGSGGNVAPSPHLRSARYLATQWRSRATQWSASSSMRNFKESSALPSSPPPPLKENDSDSDYSDTESLDESIASHVSDAHSMIEAWRSKADSMSVGSRDDDDEEEEEASDGFHSLETIKMSNSSEENEDVDGSDNEHFDVAFAFARQSKSQPNLISSPKKIAAPPIRQEMDEITNSMRPSIFANQRQPQHQTQTVENLNLPIPMKASTPSNLSESSPRTVIPPKTSPPKRVAKASMKATTKATTAKALTPQKSNLAPSKKTNNSKPSITTTTPTIPTTPTKKPSSNGTKKPKVASPSPSCFSDTTAGTAITNATAVTNMSRPHTEPTRWEEYEIVFSFSLLTNPEKAPPPGPYLPEDMCTSYKEKLHIKSPLLHSVLEKFSTTLRQIRSLTNENGKYMMCPQDCTPVTRFVEREATSAPKKGEKETVRSLVRLSVPIFVPRGDKKARTAAATVVKRTFAKAIRSGEFSGFS